MARIPGTRDAPPPARTLRGTETPVPESFRFERRPWPGEGSCYNEEFTPQGRSSVVEQRPFKPKVVGSIPTAPTNKIASKTKGSERFRRNPFFMPRTDYSENYSDSD